MLNAAGISIAILLGVPLGVLAALRRGRFLDRAARRGQRLVHEHARLRARAVCPLPVRLRGRLFPLFGPGEWVLDRFHHLALPAHRARAARHGLHDALHARGDARAARHGLRGVRAGPRARQLPRHREVRVSQRADPGGDGGRAAVHRAPDRLGPRRDCLRPARPRHAARQRRHRRGLPDGAGTAALHRGLDHLRQHRRRRPLRVHRPARRSSRRRRADGDAGRDDGADPLVRPPGRAPAGCRPSSCVLSWLVVGTVVFLAIFGTLDRAVRPAGPGPARHERPAVLRALARHRRARTRHLLAHHRGSGLRDHRAFRRRLHGPARGQRPGHPLRLSWAARPTW